LMMEALCSSETSLLKRATPPNILQNGIPHSHRRENLKSYNIIGVCMLVPSVSRQEPVKISFRKCWNILGFVNSRRFVDRVYKYQSLDMGSSVLGYCLHNKFTFKFFTRI
jgi:hypothetical protein